MSQSDYIKLKKELFVLSSPIVQQWTADKYLTNKGFYYETLNTNHILTPNQLALSVNIDQPNYIKLFSMEKGYSDISNCVATCRNLVCPSTEQRKLYNKIVNHNSYIDVTKPNVAKPQIYDANMYPTYKIKNKMNDIIVPNHRVRCNSTNTKNLKPSTYSKNIYYGFYCNVVF